MGFSAFSLRWLLLELLFELLQPGKALEEEVLGSPGGLLRWPGDGECFLSGILFLSDHHYHY